MYKSAQAGFAQFILLLIVLVGIGLGVYLVKNATFFNPQAARENLSAIVEAKTPSYEIHSFIFPNFSKGTKTYLFDSARRTNKRIVRFDVSYSEVQPQAGKWEWVLVDENMQMIKDRGLEPLITLGGAAPWIAPSGQYRPYGGPITDANMGVYIEYVKAVVRRYPDVRFFEFWNEPDISFGGTTAQFAKTLAIVYKAIKDTNPQVQVVFPGVTESAFDNSWVNKVINDPQNPAKNNFDIANAHIRGSLHNSLDSAAQIRNYFNSIGRLDAPLWITEYGFPADPEFQKIRDPQYAYGEKAQADFYQKSLPDMIQAGATKVFVSLRDKSQDEGRNPLNAFRSEGLVTFNFKSDTFGKDRQSMAIFQALGVPTTSPSPSLSSSRVTPKPSRNTPTPSSTSSPRVFPSLRVSPTPRASASSNPSSQFIYDDIALSGQVCGGGRVAASNIQTQECRIFEDKCDIPGGWTWGESDVCGGGVPSPTPFSSIISSPKVSPQPSIILTLASPQPSAGASATPKAIFRPSPFTNQPIIGGPISLPQFQDVPPPVEQPIPPEPPGPIEYLLSSIGGLFSSLFNAIIAPFK